MSNPEAQSGHDRGLHRRRPSRPRRSAWLAGAGVLIAAGLAILAVVLLSAGSGTTGDRPGGLAAGGTTAMSTSTAAPASRSAATSGGSTAHGPQASRAASSSASSGGSSPRGVIPALSDGPTGPAHDQAGADVSSVPVRVRIPSIKVDSGLQRLGLLPDKELEPPSTWQTAGWYADGARPGDVGPAIIAGHIDSTRGPAVFYRLTDLKPGAVVYIDQADHHTLRFRVDHVARYVKKAFPTSAVYGPTPQPTLRLVTCTGEFDAAHHNYLSNLVVTAYLA